jgi:formylglycine-generating enzyme required for sulfatase activity
LEVAELKFQYSRFNRLFLLAGTLMRQRPAQSTALVLILGILLTAFLSGKPGKDETLPGIDMVRIPGGEFMMGSETGEPDQRPRHRVRIDTFYLGRTEVTVAQWRSFARESAYVSWAERGHGGLIRTPKGLKIIPDANWKNPYILQDDNHPVVLVSWTDAQVFCRWLSKKTGQDYRLPTEAEWEYACRGVRGEYGDNLDSIAWYEYNSGGRTHPVGSKRPNSFGLYDMLGNVWEWCGDRYSKSYYCVSPGSNPSGPTVGLHRVSRGGSWCSKPPRANAAFRKHDAPNFRFYRQGFRLARTVRETRGQASNG